MRRTTASYLLSTLLWTGCSQASIERPERPAQKPALHLVSAQPAPAPALARVPLGTRLAEEAASRPATALRAEQLFAALERRGLLLSRKRQVLASTVGARYCALAVSDSGLGVSLCEYDDAAAAARGSETSHRLFDAIVPGRTLLAHQGSVLTLTSAESDQARRDASAIASTFTALTRVARTP